MTENTAAETVKPIKENARKKQTPNWQTKNSVASPFSCNWPDLPSGVTPEILAEIERKFKPLQNILGKRKSKNRKDTNRKKELEEKKGDKSDEEKRKLALRSQLALGVNEVTRSLEKGVLQLVMVCRSAKPAIMTSHLCALSATRSCPAIAVFNLSKILAPLLKMHTVMAVGFKKPSEVGQGTDFSDLVEFVVQRSPVIHVPWLELKDLPPKDLAKILSRKVFREQHQQQKQQTLEATGAATAVQAETPGGRTTPGGTTTPIAAGGRPDDVMVVDVRMEPGSGVRQEGRTEFDSSLDETQQERSESKKRKLQEVSASPGERAVENKKTKIAKILYQPTNVKQVKIISKVLKGKKKKKKVKK